MPDVIEALRNVRQKCLTLEMAFEKVATDRDQLGEAIQDLAGLLGSLPAGLEPVKLLEAPAPVVDAPAEKAPPPRRVARPRKAAPEPTGKLTCFRSTGRDAGPCRGKVAVVKCQHNCGWIRALCEAHREGGRESMALSAHNRVAHSAAGKAHMRELQEKGAAARDGRPKHRQARPAAKAAPAPAVDRRALIAQRAKAVKPGTKPAAPSAIPLRRSRRTVRCSNCGEPGHNSSTCRKRPDDEDAAPRAAGVSGFEDPGDLVVGHDAAPRGME